jgi:fructokinase
LKVVCGNLLYGGIHADSLRLVCAVGHSPVNIVDSARIDPENALAGCVRFFRTAEKRHGLIAALGISNLGPIKVPRGPAKADPIPSRPKLQWDPDSLDSLQAALRLPVVIDSEVRAAALAEWRHGAGRGLGSVAYVNIGARIEGAVAPADDAASRTMHAQLGHLPVERHPRDGDFIGTCPFHGDCLEGLASDAAIRARWGCALKSLPSGHEGRAIIAGYLAQMIASIAMLLPVHRVVLGGDVMADAALIPMMREAVGRYLGGFIPAFQNCGRVTEYVCTPRLGSRAALTGALLLAEQEHRRAVFR